MVDDTGLIPWLERMREEVPGVKLLDPALDPGHEPLLQIDTARGLLSAAQMNVIELHTWNATSRAIGKPDRMTFDLDPGEGVPWARMQEAAMLDRTYDLLSLRPRPPNRAERRSLLC